MIVADADSFKSYSILLVPSVVCTYYIVHLPDAVGRGGPELHPLVEQPPVVELAEQPRLGDGVRAVAHLAAPARHVAEVVVPLRGKSEESVRPPPEMARAKTSREIKKKFKKKQVGMTLI